MNRILRLTLLSAVVPLAAAAFSGCTISASTDTRFLGSVVTDSAEYTGGDICFDIEIGSAIVGEALVIENGSGSTLSATFQPFSFRPDDQEELAKSDMMDDLTMEIVEGGSCALTVRVDIAEGAYSKIGANVEVSMPDGFDGQIHIDVGNGAVDADLRGGSPTVTRVRSDNGSVDIRGAGGTLDIDIDNGSSYIGVSSWSDQDGEVHVGNGSLEFDVAAGLSGYITAVADGASPEVIGPSGGDWVSDGTSPSMSFTFGSPEPGTHGTVALTTGNGDITISN